MEATMRLKFCSCRMCKLGRKSKYNKGLITYLKRAYRHKVKQLLKKGIDDLPEVIPVPYTD